MARAAVHRAKRSCLGAYAVAETSYTAGGPTALLNSPEVVSLLSGIASRGADVANSMRSEDRMYRRPYESRAFTGRRRAHAQIFDVTPHGKHGTRKDMALVKGLLSGV